MVYYLLLPFLYNIAFTVATATFILILYKFMVSYPHDLNIAGDIPQPLWSRVASLRAQESTTYLYTGKKKMSLT